MRHPGRDANRLAGFHPRSLTTASDK
jgi:hypothetical protein